MTFTYNLNDLELSVQALGAWASMLDDDDSMTGAEIKQAICEAFS